MNQTITPRQHDTLQAVSQGAKDVNALAEKLEVSVAAVRAQLRTLRDNGLVEGTSGDLTVTADGRSFVGGKGGKGNNNQNRGQQQQGGDDQVTHREGTKIAQAREILEKNWNKGRKAVIEMFQKNLKMTPSGASTYYQSLRHETGLAYQQARDNGKGGNQTDNGNNRGGKQQNSGNRGRSNTGKGNRPTAK